MEDNRSIGDIMLDTQRKFFNQLWPEEGRRCIAIKFEKGFKNLFFDSTEEAIDQINKLNKQGADVYHACFTFEKRGSRKQENALATRAFWFDIDVREGKSEHYYTKREALENIVAFNKAIGKFPLAIIDSGGGYHAYFFMFEDISSDVWKNISGRLREAAKEFNLYVDHSRTSDQSSTLRPPGTVNTKYGTVVKWLNEPKNS